MSDKAAIAATFSDFKLIRGRKVAQLVLEIPIEKAQDALSALGMPIPGEELWCAVARLKSNPGTMGEQHGRTCAESAGTDGGVERKRRSDEAPVRQNDRLDTQSVSSPTSPAKPKQKWSELKPSAQAALRCTDPDFQRFVDVCLGGAGKERRSEDECAIFIRNECEVSSRRGLDHSNFAKGEWQRLNDGYLEWLGQQRALAQHEAYAR